MNTCKTCEEFNPNTDTCGCPLNAFPCTYSDEYKYHRTTADDKACGFYSKIIVIKKEVA